MNRTTLLAAATLTACTFASVKVAAALICHDDFNVSAGTAMNGVNTGSGWAAAWEWHNEVGDDHVYEISSSSPLTYSNLVTTGNYCTVHVQPDRLGRMLDVGGAFSNYSSDGNMIGKPGTTLWMSVLYRKDDADATKTIWISTHQAPGPADNDDSAEWAVGIFMQYKNNESQGADGKVYWTLGAGTCGINNTCPTYQLTTKQAVAGQTVLCVVKFEFQAASANISLYMNPSSLGASAPASADAQVTTPAAVAFRAFAFEGTGLASMDEIRFGDSYADVTPATGTAVGPTINGRMPSALAGLQGKNVQNGDYSIVNVSGRTVAKATATGGMLDCSSLRSGVYVVCAGDKHVETLLKR